MLLSGCHASHKKILLPFPSIIPVPFIWEEKESKTIEEKILPLEHNIVALLGFEPVTSQ
jgi:hypothetical protein